MVSKLYFSYVTVARSITLSPAVPDPVSGLKVVAVSLTNANISWTNSHTLFKPVQFIIVHESINCHNFSSKYYETEVTPFSIMLQPGQEYNFSVIAINPIDDSNETTLTYRMPSAS